MTYRNFSPEMLNAGRARRPQAPTQRSSSDFLQEHTGRGAGVSDLTRELEAIAQELSRLKTGQTMRAATAASPNAGAAFASQSAFDANQLGAMVQTLKTEVRTQMRDDLDAQYERLRDDLDGLNSAIAGTALQGSFKNEISQLLSGLETLASGNRSIQVSHDKLSDYLQRELGDLQSSLQGLAKSESINRLDDRWNSFETRWNKLENRLDKGLSSDSTAHFSDISSRLQLLQEKMNDGGLESLENRLLMLAKSVDALAHSRTSGASAAVDFSQIEKRFDELSRAVAAIGAERAAPAIDNQAINQIENAISLLGRKLELVGTMSGQNPSLDAIEERLSQLNERFSQLPDYFSNEPVMERIDRLAEKVSSLPAPTLSPASIDALTQQLSNLAVEVRGNVGGKPISDGMFNRLDNRLGSIEDRISSLSFGEAGAADTDTVIAALESRFLELSAHLEAMQPSHAAPASVDVDLTSLELKLSDIARQLSHSPAPALGMDAFDRLESQLSELTAKLATGSGNNDHGLAERLDSLERLLSKNQLTVLDSARKVAEDAALRLQSTGTDNGNAHIVGVIAGELATLEQLTRTSNDRSASAFEGMHGALTKIADRLAELETKSAASYVSTPHSNQTVPEKTAPRASGASSAFVDDDFFAPSVEAAESDLGNLDLQNEPAIRKTRSPSEMAQEAANAALRNLNPQSAAAAAAMQSMPGGELEDVPLNPGTAVPDLNSILKRVREQKKAAQTQVAKDVDRKDHFLSIKRAAQAAANEVQQVEPTANTGGALGNLKTIYAKFRRPILMVATAAVIAIAAIQLTSALVSNDSEPTIEANVEPEASQVPALAPAVALPDTLQSSAADVAIEAKPGETVADLNNDAGTAVPVAGDQTAGDTPRIVGAEPLEAQSTEITSLSSQTDTGLDATATPEAGISASVEEPTVPSGFGPPALVESANTKDMKAQFEMGRRLAENQNDPALLANAFAWFNASASQGFAPAQYRVGNMYEKGLGVERSATEAKLWYQMAAEAGNASAMHNLAVLFASGADGTVDSASALRWFQKAADLGVGDSQFNLGVMKGKGQGVPQDLEESYKWLAILAKSGDVEAGAKRDEVAKTMRPEQLEAAKAKVELWKPQPVIAEANDINIPDGWKIANATTASVDVKKAVKNVQLILTKLGYNVGTPDGVMGENTRKAIRAFQKKENLSVSGEIDGPTVKALLAKNS